MHPRRFFKFLPLIAVLGTSACVSAAPIAHPVTSSPTDVQGTMSVPLSATVAITPLVTATCTSGPIPVTSTVIGISTPVPSPTSTSLPSPTSALCDHALYRQSCAGECAYTSWDQEMSKTDYYEDMHCPPEGCTPVDNATVAFANYANLMAYWTYTDPAHWVLSDFDLKQSSPLFTDFADTYPHDEVQSLWSPDDLHVILDVEGESVPGLIYHLQTGKLENWPWKCDRVGVSPRTGQLAEWCTPVAQEKKYAVIEWGGNIWYSDAPPSTEITRKLDDHPPVWAWSKDGKQIAFYSYSESEWHVSIATAAGIVTTLPMIVVDPRGFPWQMTKIHWSFDGRRLLFQALGSPKFPCPLLQGIGNPAGNTAGPRQCWQVVDTKTNQTIWSMGMSGTQMNKALRSDVITWYTDRAGISPDGSQVAFSLTDNRTRDNALMVIDISSGQTSVLWSRATVTMRWCNR